MFLAIPAHDASLLRDNVCRPTGPRRSASQRETRRQRQSSRWIVVTETLRPWRPMIIIYRAGHRPAAVDTVGKVPSEQNPIKSNDTYFAIGQSLFGLMELG